MKYAFGSLRLRTAHWAFGRGERDASRVILKTDHNEYLLLGHFQQHTIAEKQGQTMKPGQFLGNRGNSGSSSESRLHFHVQNTEDMDAATGLKCYFEQLQANGTLKNDYSPIKEDRVMHHGK